MTVFLGATPPVEPTFLFVDSRYNTQHIRVASTAPPPNFIYHFLSQHTFQSSTRTYRSPASAIVGVRRLILAIFHFFRYPVVLYPSHEESRPLAAPQAGLISLFRIETKKKPNRTLGLSYSPLHFKFSAVDILIDHVPFRFPYDARFSPFFLCHISPSPVPSCTFSCLFPPM